MEGRERVVGVWPGDMDRALMGTFRGDNVPRFVEVSVRDMPSGPRAVAPERETRGEIGGELAEGEDAGCPTRPYSYGFGSRSAVSEKRRPPELYPVGASSFSNMSSQRFLRFLETKIEMVVTTKEGDLHDEPDNENKCCEEEKASDGPTNNRSPRGGGFRVISVIRLGGRGSDSGSRNKRGNSDFLY